MKNRRRIGHPRGKNRTTTNLIKRKEKKRTPTKEKDTKEKDTHKFNQKKRISTNSTINDKFMGVLFSLLMTNLWVSFSLLVAQRMKCSGMRWRNPGGQGILTLRSLIQSDWFDNGWRLLSFTYRAWISDPYDNVIPFPNKIEP